MRFENQPKRLRYDKIPKRCKGTTKELLGKEEEEEASSLLIFVLSLYASSVIVANLDCLRLGELNVMVLLLYIDNNSRVQHKEQQPKRGRGGCRFCCWVPFHFHRSSSRTVFRFVSKDITAQWSEQRKEGSHGQTCRKVRYPLDLSRKTTRNLAKAATCGMLTVWTILNDSRSWKDWKVGPEKTDTRPPLFVPILVAEVFDLRKFCETV